MRTAMTTGSCRLVGRGRARSLAGALIGLLVPLTGCTAILGDFTSGPATDSGVDSSRPDHADSGHDARPHPPSDSGHDARLDVAREAGKDAAPDAVEDASTRDAPASDAGSCTPFATRCAGPSLETCSSNGQWGAATTCVAGATCMGGACTCLTTYTTFRSTSNTYSTPLVVQYQMIGGGGGAGNENGGAEAPTGGGGGSSALLTGDTVLAYASGGAGNASAAPAVSGMLTLSPSANFTISSAEGVAVGTRPPRPTPAAAAAAATTAVPVAPMPRAGPTRRRANRARTPAAAVGLSAAPPRCPGRAARARSGGAQGARAPEPRGAVVDFGGGGGAAGNPNGGAGGTAGLDGAPGGGGQSGGLGANEWSGASTLPDAAGMAGAQPFGGGNAGLVILMYALPAGQGCSL